MRALLSCAFGLVATLLTACAAPSFERADLAITNVWVHDGSNDDPVLTNIAVREGRIIAIGKAVSARTTIDGRNRHLVPGLIDMHVHVAAVAGRIVPNELFLRRGVTTVRDLGGFRDQVIAASAAATSLRIFSAIQTLNGKPMAAFHRVVTTEADVRGAVNDLADRGANVIKIHRAFPPALVPVVVSAARARGLSVTGHIPLGLHPLQACQQGMKGIEHVGSFVEAYVSAVKDATQDKAIRYMLSKESEPLYRCLATRGVAVTPTLVLYQSIARARTGGGPLPAEFRKFIAAMQAITLRLQRSGVPLMAGTDASGLDKPAVEPGISLLEELTLLRSAGLDSAEVMATAGKNAALVLGLARDGRQIAPGRRADFLLLAGDPRKNIDVLRTPSAIYFDGRSIIH